MKKLTLLLSVCLPLLMAAQTTGERVMLGGKPSVFNWRIQPREVVDPAQPQKHLTGDEQIAQWDKQREALIGKKQDRRFVGAMQLAEQAKAYRARNVKERMDSVVVRQGNNDPNGAPISKQVFTYDEAGRPLTCINSLPDAETGGWNYYGEYGYEWDDEGHMIAVWAINDPNEGTFKYEFIYANGGNLYTNQIYYSLENEEWVPAQMAEYTFDEAGNTIEEVYSLYNAETGDWDQSERHTATYEEHGWMTSYFVYTWDANSGAWVGKNANTSNYRWEYTSDGADALEEQYAWIDNDWLAYRRLVYTRDENNLVTQTEWQYWNFEHNDWRGGYTAQSGYVQNNSKTLYYYDDQRRLVRQETYNRTAEQDYTTYYTYDTIEYTELPETNETENVRCTYANIGSGSIELYRRYTSRHKPVASAATFYLSERKLTAGTDIMIKVEEETRDIDDNGYYHGLETYSYTPNETNFRMGSSKELVTYDEEMRQTGTHHWRGRRTGADSWVWDDYDDWKVYNVEGYDGNVVSGYDLYNYSGTNMYPYYGFLTTFDFTMRPENMTKWISTNSDNFRKYKYLQTYNWENRGSATQEDIYEYTNLYYYTEIGEAEGGWNEDGTPITLANSGAQTLEAVQADNGEIYVGWTKYGSTGYDATVQLVDVEGYNVLGQDGQQVNTNGSSANNTMLGMAIDSENNLVVSFPDARNQESRWNAKPYVYKMGNTNGESLWTANGVALPTTVDANVMQHVIAAGDNFYVTFNDANDYSAHTYYVNRVNAAGELAWEESKALPGAFASFVPSDDNILMVYCQDSKVYAERRNADFEAFRAAPQVISGDVQINSLPYTGNMFTCQSDGNGGMVVVFCDASYNANYYMQHINADGTALAQPVKVSEQAIEGLKMAVDADNQQVVLAYQAGDWNGRALNMQVLDLDGNVVMPETAIADMSSGYTVSGLKAVNGDYVVAYVNSVSYSQTEQYVARVSLADRKVYGAKVGDGATTTATDAVVDNTAVYYFWSSSVMDYETYEVTEAIKGVRYFLGDITDVMMELPFSGVVDIKAEQQADGVAYDIMGRRVNPETARGIIIINGKKIVK